MYMLNDKHIVKEEQSLDLHRLLDTNKVYLKDILKVTMKLCNNKLIIIMALIILSNLVK